MKDSLIYERVFSPLNEERLMVRTESGRFLGHVVCAWWQSKWIAFDAQGRSTGQRFARVADTAPWFQSKNPEP